MVETLVHGPDGDTGSRVRFGPDGASVTGVAGDGNAPGRDPADVVLVSDVATAWALHQGTVRAQDAFARGALKVRGRPELLAADGELLAALERAFAPVRAETTAPAATRRARRVRRPRRTGRLGAVQPFERLRAIARHGGDDRLLVAEAADCLGEFDDDPAALVVTCRRLLHHHPERAPLWWLCARVLAAPEPSEAAWDAEALVRDDRTADRLSGLLPFPADHPVAVLGWPTTTGDALGAAPRPRGARRARRRPVRSWCVVATSGGGPGWPAPTPAPARSISPRRSRSSRRTC